MSAYRVLIVDDQRDVRRVLRAALETLGQDVKVTDVPSGEEAILVISRQPIELLITDVRLPGISGLELKDRARVRNPDMRMILMTGLTEPKIRREVEQSGVDAYFYKPIEMAAFLDTVQGFMAGLVPTPAPEPAPVAAKPSTPARPAPPAEIAPVLAAMSAAPAATPQPSLAERLARLRQELKAFSTLLVDERGQVIAQAGELPIELGKEALLPQLGLAFGAATKLSLQMGVNLPRGLLYFPAQAQDFFLTNVGQNVGLLIVAASGVWEESRLGDLLTITRQAARDLLEMLATWGVDLAEASAGQPVPSVEAPAAVAEADLANILPELDAIFGKVDTNKLKTEDVNAFWDSLTSGAQDEISSADAITFDQARQLGLAPDDN